VLTIATHYNAIRGDVQVKTDNLFVLEQLFGYNGYAAQVTRRVSRLTSWEILMNAIEVHELGRIYQAKIGVLRRKVKEVLAVDGPFQLDSTHQLPGFQNRHASQLHAVLHLPGHVGHRA
jgi:hypothetical protein